MQRELGLPFCRWPEMRSLNTLAQWGTWVRALKYLNMIINAHQAILNAY